MSSELSVNVTPVGRVRIRVMDAATQRVIESFEYHNNVLNVGRRALLRGLSGIQASDTVFNTCVVGDGGAYLNGSEYVERQVTRDRDGLFGVERDTLAVVSRVNEDANGMPYAVVSCVLGAESSANGSLVSELGLTLKSGAMYALMTWPGTQKTSSISIGFDWLVFFL